MILFFDPATIVKVSISWYNIQASKRPVVIKATPLLTKCLQNLLTRATQLIFLSIHVPVLVLHEGHQTN